MPKTYKHLYQEIISFENLYLAFKDARRLKSEKPEVLEFSYRAEERLWDIHNKLEKHIWTPGPYREFLSKTEVKRRVIHAPTFADRVVHMALFRILMPIFEERFIYDSYACRKNKGTLAAVNRTQDFLRRARNSFDKTYVLQGDFQKCYDSIYKPALLRNFARRISDHEVLDLLTLIYYSSDDSHGQARGVLLSSVGYDRTPRGLWDVSINLFRAGLFLPSAPLSALRPRRMEARHQQKGSSKWKRQPALGASSISQGYCLVVTIYMVMRQS